MDKTDQSLGNFDRCRFYAVYGGTSPGVYHSWREASPHCHKIPGAIPKGFNNRADAETWAAHGPVLSTNYYAVPGEGIYDSWAQARPKAEKRSDHSRPVKKFDNLQAAEEYMILCGDVKVEETSVAGLPSRL